MAVSKRLRYEILRRDNFTCRYCMTATPGTPLRVDHVVPVALGGTDDATNLVTSCEPCNSGKSSSAPDASLIASASDDQLRWALAMKQAAEAAATKRSEMDDYRSAFRKEWSQWTSGGKQFDLPGDWTITMDRFHNAGLPAFMWDEIVTKAMTNQYVDDPFKYVCGIAWSKVTELQEAARKLLTKPSVNADPAEVNEEGSENWTLLEDLLPTFGKQRYEAALACVQDLHDDENFSDLELSERAASMAAYTLADDANCLERRLQRLLTLLPASEVLNAQMAAGSTEQACSSPGPAIPSARLLASTVEQFLHARSGMAVLAMTPAEVNEWMQYAATVFNDASDPNPWGDPTEESLRRRAGEASLMFRAGWQYADMCGLPGDHIETCPRRTKTQISFPGCSDCGIAPSPPEGIDVCSEHFELVLAGEYCQHNTIIAERRDR